MIIVVMAYNRPFSFLQHDQDKVLVKNRKTVPLLTPKPSSTTEKSGSVTVSNVPAFFSRSQPFTGSSIDGGQHGIQQGAAGRTSQDLRTTHGVSPSSNRERNQQVSTWRATAGSSREEKYFKESSRVSLPSPTWKTSNFDEQGAIPKQENLPRQFPSRRSHELSTESNSKQQEKHSPNHRKNYALKFYSIQKLIEEDAQPEIIARRFAETETGLKQFLENNSANWDAIELVLVVIGHFCEKKGVVLFHNTFIKIVQILAEENVFSNLNSVILNVPKSRSNNLGSKNERFRKLIKSLTYLTTEMLTVMPALTCDYLGEKFVEDICALKDIPSIRDANVDEVFSTFHKEGAERLKNAWEQHSKAKSPSTNESHRDAIRFQRQELMIHLKPPDDFRQLSVMPECEDVCGDTEPFLRPNLIKGSYPDVDTYLDIQFRLLREDFLSPLREGLLAYRTKKEKHQNQQIRVDNIRLYYDVKINPEENPISQQQLYTLEFSTKGLQRVNWEGSKRLIYGSLLLLSADNFNSFMLFTVVDRKPEQLSRGRIKTKFEGESLPTYASKTNLVMAETSVFFEAYRSVLIALQRISPAHFPMEDYILCRNVSPTEPDYLKRIPIPIYDLTPVRVSNSTTENENNEDDSRYEKGKLLNPALHRLLEHVSLFGQSLPDNETLGLDPSQADALYAALTRKLVVIQGPPGTGKTYLGLKIVQTLLHNKKYWVGVDKPKPTPILVICYTNHALDQFLEGISKFTKKIVRIGGQSKCEAVQQFMLIEWKKQAVAQRKRPQQYRQWLAESRSNLNETRSALERSQTTQRIVESFVIIHENCLLNLKVLSQIEYVKVKATNTVSNNSALTQWLGVQSIQTLKETLRAFEKIVPKTKEPPVAIERKTLKDEELNEEEWDKEDVDEIQGERMMEEEVHVSQSDFAGVKMKSEKTMESEGGKIQYAFSTQTLNQKINSLQESLNELEDDDIELVQFHIAEIKQQKELFQEILKILPIVDKKEYKQLIERDLARLSFVDRWKIYSFWRAEISEMLAAEINLLYRHYQHQTNEMKDVETIETAEIIREAHVVGITTTGAAKNRALLEHLKSKIVVVEEAAEVLEAHIVTSMSSSCEHLILIGDHKQLRPPTTVYTLAKDYHLDVSLFERLVMNGVEPNLLGVQHRMRPDVARLIVPSIYPHLENHRSVLKYWDVPGMAESVFFLSHLEREKGDQSDQESRSHLNPYEADMSLALARHLLMQGLEPSQITILTTYSGQLLHFKKLRRSHAMLQGVRISIVDNFQGEENDIIILSLVRSNDEAKVGFLKTENRVCVALSRAKKGFYLIGNMSNLAGSSKLWREVNKVLTSNGQIGPHFDLQCEVHQTVIKASKVSHFPPEGGCFNQCLTPMPCGHICPKICHAEDREHTRQKCHEACMRSCSVGHPCPKKCYQDCNPCLTRIPKIILPCNHTQITECYKDPEKEYCLTKVVKALPICKHTMELDCGKSVVEIKCPEQCGMHLDCDHICNQICHKRSSHAKMPCTQPCRRFTCPEKHPCPKQCHEECGKCLVDVVKKLPCGHDGEIKCWQLPKDAYCKVKVERILSDCQHTAFFDCSQSTEGYRCTRMCGKLLCNDGHVCRKPCFEPCGPCNIQVKRTLVCGHEIQTACYKDPLTIKCKFPKVVTLPGCGHRVEIACSDNPETVLCPKPCDTRLDCGHQCTELCHVKSDPYHEKYLCKKTCSRNKMDCKQDHKCGKKCHEDCDLCIMKIERRLPCGHSQVAECCLDDEDIKCRVMVNKTIIECMHSIRVECSTIASRRLCSQPCVKFMSCGHQCKMQCRETCSPLVCQELVRTSLLSPCGHPVMKTCNDHQSSPVVSQTQVEKFLQDCPQKCRANLSCEHSCKGSCGQCFNGRLHKACEEKCGRTLVCGHNCGVNCAISCPPCKEMCEYRCRHSRCRKKCCEPCVECIEPCGWECEHYSCSLKCFEYCNRPRCDEPCRKRLPCGHSCVGLCGEICPPLCRVCNKDQLTEFVLYGNEEEEDARFIYLQDCQHTIEVEGMDHWMEMKEEETVEIQMKCCPRCKTIIRSCYRYGNVIKRNFGDIVEVKRELLRNRVSSKEIIEKLLNQIKDSDALNSELASKLNHSITEVLKNELKCIRDSLNPNMVGKRLKYKSLDDDTRYMLEVKIDVIASVLSSLRNAPKITSSASPIAIGTMDPALLKDFLDRAQKIVASLFHRERFSVQEYDCFIAEVNRLDLIRAYFLIKSSSHMFNRNSLISEENRLVEDLLMKNTKPLKKQESEAIKDIFQRIGKKLNTGLGISETEREQIVKAMGFKQGHWFKCPNGHIYVIADCGGAMHEAKCNECGEKIGGGNHSLRSDNRLASEMDGARFAAWSEHANNMGNFQIQD